MAWKKVDFDTVRTLGLSLPGVTEGTAWGSPALKVAGQLLACLAVHQSAEPDTLVVSIDFDQRAELMEAAPQTYYVTEHYRNHPVVLVRLWEIRPDALRDLLAMAWRFATGKNKKKPQSPPPR